MKSRDIAIVGILLAVGAILRYFLAMLHTPLTPNMIIAFYCLAIILISPKIYEAFGIGIVAGILSMLISGSIFPPANLISEPVGALVCFGVYAAIKNRSKIIPLHCHVHHNARERVYLCRNCNYRRGTPDHHQVCDHGWIYRCIRPDRSYYRNIQCRYCPAALHPVKQGADAGTGMIRLDSVSYAYPHTGKPALTDLSLSVGKGQCVMITGPSGAGKTTLCLASAGILAHEYGGKKEGTVTIDGRDVKSYKDLSDIASNLGIVFDDPEAQLIFTTVEEEILSALERRGLQVDEIEDRLRVIMEMTKLTTLKDRAPHTLSGGQKQRLVLAVTLALGTGILILDEPTSELDEHGTSGILEILKGLKAQGRTILLVEHKFLRMREIVDTLVVMEEGRIRAAGNPDEIIRDPGVQKIVIPDFSGIRERTQESGENVIH